MFSRKFPFYKSREASDGETSDVERKYSLAWRRGLSFACLRLVSDRKRAQLVVLEPTLGHGGGTLAQTQIGECDDCFWSPVQKPRVSVLDPLCSLSVVVSL